MLLGFRGKYSASGTSGEIRAILQSIDEKIRRIRGGISMPAWQPPAQLLAPPKDKWIPMLKWVAIGCGVFALVLFAVFKVLLSSAAGDLSTLASRVSF
jgi:type VI protein secretion system component VasF